jgi:hypothetical protein
VADVSWGILIAIGSVVVAALVLAARGGPSRRRASLLASAAGIVYGLTAALTKATAHLLGLGLGHVILSPQLAGLIVFGALGMLLAQSAFQAGPLDASLPILTVTDPIVSIAIGAAVFDETIALGAVSSTLEVFGLILVVVGVFALGRSEAVVGHSDLPAGAG